MPSPETRHQGDIKLTYAWDEVMLSLGGGISTERDYESRFVNLGGSFDFNQKQTTLNWGASYTNSDTQADLDPDGMRFYNWDRFVHYSDDGSKLLTKPGFIGNIDYVEGGFFEFNRFTILGNREDLSGQLGFTQVLGKNSLLDMSLTYIRSTGYLSNPYKFVYSTTIVTQVGQKHYQLDHQNFKAGPENRPGERNQFNWHLGYDHYIEFLNAALHFDYAFAHDDWNINAHTFEADWVQPLGAGWTITPRIRYYSQSAA